MQNVINNAIESAYRKYCSKSCPVVFWKDNCGSCDWEEKDNISETHCDGCLIKHFIINGLNINIE